MKKSKISCKNNWLTGNFHLLYGKTYMQNIALEVEVQAKKFKWNSEKLQREKEVWRWVQKLLWTQKIQRISKKRKWKVCSFLKLYRI